MAAVPTHRNGSPPIVWAQNGHNTRGVLGCALVGTTRGYIDLDSFRHQLADLVISEYWIAWGLTLVDDSPWVVEAARRDKRDLAALPPDLPPEELSILADDIRKAKGSAEGVSRRNREVVARAAYVYAWAAFQVLLGQIARVVFTAHPKRLIPYVNEKAALELVRARLNGAGTWPLRKRIIGPAARRVSRLGPRKLAKRWATDIKVALPTRFVERLAVLHRLRNQAAHDVLFPTPDRSIVGDDI